MISLMLKRKKKREIMMVIKKDIQSYILAIDPSKMYDCTSFFMAIKRPAWNA